MSRTSKRILLGGAFAALGLGGYFATSPAQDGRISAEALHQATPAPDRVVLTWDGNPASSQAVTWRTDTSVQEPVAQLAEATDGPQFTASAARVSATSEKLVSDLGEALYHTARFENLQPNTIYAYRVGDGANWSEWNQFRTASDKPDPLTFLYVGDAQNNIFEHWSRVIRAGFMAAPKAQFLLHAGDLVNSKNRDAEWGEWFEAAGWIDRSVPSIPTPGNHEYGGDPRGLSIHWRPQFALPENGPKELPETAYYIDIQGVRIVSLNSNEMQDEQAVWLDTLLGQNLNKWTILTFHHPIHSTAEGRDNRRLREAWQPIFDKHAVDLVLTGHDHSYGRSNLMTGVNTRTGANGTVYAVSVSGPKQYELNRQDWMERAGSHTQLFQIIHVDGDTLRFEARTARGVLYDAFELHKRPGAANELINHVPETPERLTE